MLYWVLFESACFLFIFLSHFFRYIEHTYFVFQYLLLELSTIYSFGHFWHLVLFACVHACIESAIPQKGFAFAFVTYLREPQTFDFYLFVTTLIFLLETSWTIEGRVDLVRSPNAIDLMVLTSGERWSQRNSFLIVFFCLVGFISHSPAFRVSVLLAAYHTGLLGLCVTFLLL